MPGIFHDGKRTLSFAEDLIRIAGVPVWNISGATGRDPRTGVLLDGLNERVLAAAKSGSGDEPSATEYLSKLAMEIDSLGSEIERRMHTDSLADVASDHIQTSRFRSKSSE